MISAIVFDFDGVLVDSEPLHLRSYQEVLEPFGLSLPREKYYSSYLGYDDAGVFKAIAEARDWPLDEQKAPRAHRGERPGVRSAEVRR